MAVEQIPYNPKMEFIAYPVCESHVGTCHETRDGKPMVRLELRCADGEEFNFVLSAEHASVLGRDLIHEGDALQAGTN